MQAWAWGWGGGVQMGVGVEERMGGQRVEDFHYKITYLLGRFVLPPLHSNHTGGPLSFVPPPAPPAPLPPTLQEAAKAEHTEEQAH